jgi:hypothetical protein
MCKHHRSLARAIIAMIPVPHLHFHLSTLVMVQYFGARPCMSIAASVAQLAGLARVSVTRPRSDKKIKSPCPSYCTKPPSMLYTLTRLGGTLKGCPPLSAHAYGHENSTSFVSMWRAHSHIGIWLLFSL